MDVIEHVPMFRAIFHLLRSFAACPKVSSILVPPPGDGSSISSGSQSIYWLLRKLRNFIPRHVSTTATGAKVDDPDGELTELSEDLILTFTVVKTVVISDHHPRWAIQTPESTLTSDKLYRDTMMAGRNPFAVRSPTAGRMSGGESNGNANHASTPSSIIAPSRFGAPAAANTASPHTTYKASDSNGSPTPLLRPSLIGAPSSSILKPATLGYSPALPSIPFSRPVEVDVDVYLPSRVAGAEGAAAAALPDIPSLNLLSASASPAPTSAAVSIGNNFVFGQKLHERNPNHAAAEPKAGGTPVTESFLDVTPKEKSEAESASSNGLPAPSMTLNDSVKMEEEKTRAAKRKYEEVTVVTGEEGEENALEVDGKLFIFDKAKGNWIERGFGDLRLNDKKLENQTLQSRLVMRTKGSRRVILNTNVWAEMIIEKTGTKSIRLTGMDDVQVRVFLLQASPRDTEILTNALEGRLKTLRAQQARATPAAAAAAAAAAELDQACDN
nr:EOG090X078K [Chydorus sphaericus]